MKVYKVLTLSEDIASEKYGGQTDHGNEMSIHLNNRLSEINAALQTKFNRPLSDRELFQVHSFSTQNDSHDGDTYWNVLLVSEWLDDPRKVAG